VEAVNDCPLLLDFEMVILKISRYLFLHNCAVWIEQKKCVVIVKVLYHEGHHDLEKFRMESIPSGNFRRRVRQTRNMKTIWVFGNH
jgi:hypothetical protein